MTTDLFAQLITNAQTGFVPEWSPSRYPFTYAADMIRINPQIVPSEVTGDEDLLARIIHHVPQGHFAGGDWVMTRQEAAMLREAWAAFAGYDDEDLARDLADAYLHIHGVDNPESDR